MTIDVGGDYQVHIGEFSEADIEIEPQPSSIFLITDDNVWESLGKRFSGFDAKLVLPAGEATKSIRRWTECQVWLSQRGADRRSLILALGGGVVGDLAGFVASTFMRGIRYVNIATSLVAQIDSGVGGKTAVDLPEAKNLVGSFHNPSAVYCDVSYLDTLPDREYVAGMAEAIKYGAILDESFLSWQETNEQNLRQKDRGALSHLVNTCVQMKAGVVTSDMLETVGERAKLNFGHTVGHALETALDYKGILHGEAVAVGMIIEARIGEKIGFTQLGSSGRLEHILSRWGLPTKLPSKGLAERMLSIMTKDKKAEKGEIAITLIKCPGESELYRSVPPNLVREVLTTE